MTAFTIPKFDELIPPDTFVPPEAVPIPEDTAPERVPDPDPVSPPAPNLDGDDVMFARYHPETGEVISHGFMHRDHLQAETKAGAHIVEHGEHGITLDRHRIHPKTRKIVPFTPARDPAKEKQTALDAIRGTIATALAEADKYFTTDALDNITEQEQARWRAYRQKLRAASKLADPGDMLANVPAPPKGVDMLDPLRPKAPKA